MSLEAVKSGLAGGSALVRVLTELQGLSMTVVAGAAAATKMNVAAMRAEDTLKAVLDITTPADDSANCSISGTQAKGTITASTVVAGATVTVNGVTYTFQAGAAATLAAPYTNVNLGTTDTTAMANLAAAINAVEGTRATGGKQVVAAANVAVVTVTAAADGTAGNAITLTKNGATLAVSAATLTGGTATGGFTSTTNNTGKTLLVFWANKR